MQVKNLLRPVWRKLTARFGHTNSIMYSRSTTMFSRSDPSNPSIEFQNKGPTNFEKWAENPNTDPFNTPLKGVQTFIKDADLETSIMLYKHKNFNRDIFPVLHFVGHAGFSPDQMTFFYKNFPELLTRNPAAPWHKNNIMGVIQFLRSAAGPNLSDTDIRGVLMKSKKAWIFRFSTEELGQRLADLQEIFPRKDFIKEVLLKHPDSLFSESITDYREIYLKNFENHGYNQKTAIKMIYKYPELMVFGDTLLSQYEKWDKFFGEFNQELEKFEPFDFKKFFATANPKFLRTEPGMFGNNLRFIHKNLQVSKEKFCEILPGNSWLLLINPEREFFPIIEMLKKFGLTEKNIGQVLVRDANVLNPKRNNLFELKEKLKYLTLRLNLSLEIKEGGIFPEILGKSYSSWIQPRGEIMVKTGNVKMLEETYRLKTEEFIKLMGVSKNMMQVQLNRTGTK
jgi:hypothetical protein